MKLINTRNHDIVIMNANNEVILCIKPHKDYQVTVATFPIDSGIRVKGFDWIPITVTKFGDPINLPPMTADVKYIVSKQVKQALPNRSDLLVPSELVRDECNIVIGCKSLGM